MSLDFSSVKNAGRLNLAPVIVFKGAKRKITTVANLLFLSTITVSFLFIAFGLFQKKGRLFSLSASNALLEFLLEGAPQVREHLKGR